MRPTSRMRTSTNPDDTTCEAEFTAGPLSITTRLTNDQFFDVARLLDHAYEAGRSEGMREVWRTIEQAIEGYDK